MRQHVKWMVGALLTIAVMTAPTAYAQTTYWSYSRTFTTQPSVTVIPSTGVWYSRGSNYDLYRYGNTWYIADNGTWYRSETWEGPFAYVRVNTVPRAIMTVPSDYRSQWVTVTTSDNDTYYNYRDNDRYRDRYNYNDRDRYYTDRTRFSTRTFVRKPRMMTISATGVQYARNASDYDLYRYRSTWYLVDDGMWYRASSWRGPFVLVSFRDVPREVRRVPSGYRRNWSEPVTYGRSGRYWTRTFMYEPRMAVIPDTRVMYMRDESDYDVYRYGNTWYVVDNGTWYSSNSWRGPFIQISTRSVPRDVITVPSGYHRTWVTPSWIYED